jgi:CHAD domain-containing protein/CYTH domain-containing protein
VSVEVLRLPTPEAVTRLCLGLVSEARAAEARLDDPGAVEALHDFRVALRRLRSALRTWREPLGGAVRGRDRGALRRLQRATGGGRDAEVALAWLEKQRAACSPEHAAGVEWLASRWREQLARTHQALEGELRARFRGAAERLERRLPRASGPGRAQPFGDELAGAARAAAADLAAKLARISGAADGEAMHCARIACKRLRYLLEPLREDTAAAAELIDACKVLQTLLGDLNDTAAIGAALEAALGESAAQRSARVSGLIRAGYADRARREAWFTEWPGLIELARLLADERALLFARLERDWLGAGVEKLQDHVRVLGDTLGVLVHGQPEIERKFLLRALPALEGRGAQALLIEQGWVCGAGLPERIRAQSDASGTRYFRTLKLGSGAVRSELETEIAPQLHAELWPRTLGCRLRKRRHRVRDGALTFEIDEFLDRDLVLAEVELPCESARLALPDWLAPLVQREVTGEREYTGSGLGL